MNDQTPFQFQIASSAQPNHAAICREDILERLLEFYSADEAERWLTLAQPKLGSESPDAVIADGLAGYKKVCEQVAELEARIYL